MIEYIVKTRDILPGDILLEATWYYCLPVFVLSTKKVNNAHVDIWIVKGFGAYGSVKLDLYAGERKVLRAA